MHINIDNKSYKKLLKEEAVPNKMYVRLEVGRPSELNVDNSGRN
jgi:hypothetical protein